MADVPPFSELIAATTPEWCPNRWQTFIRFEYEGTAALNLAAGEEVRWLPRRRASDLCLPDNDFWVFDDRLVRLHHFAGNGEFLDYEFSDDPALVNHCVRAFEAIWEHAIPHAEYRPTQR